MWRLAHSMSLARKGDGILNTTDFLDLGEIIINWARVSKSEVTKQPIIPESSFSKLLPGPNLLF